MNIYSYEKVNNFRIFSPRAENSYRRLQINSKNNLGNFNEYSKFTNVGNSKNPINLYYSPKNISIPQNSKIPKIYSPLHKKLNKLYHSSSKNNFNVRPLSCNARALPSVQSFSYIKSPKSKNKKEKSKKNNFFNLEKEKLYQETYQIKKVVKILTKKLSSLKKENSKRERLINKKQKRINDIILNNNNDSIYENNYLYINNNNNNSFNDFSTSLNNISINSNLNLNNKKNSPNKNLYIKIKGAIAQINNEIKIEKEKYEKLKKSLFLTKMNELKTESILLEEQINKINSFINKAFLVQEDNNKKKNEYLNLKENIDKQKNIINSLNERYNLLNNEENKLNEQLEKIKKNINLKNKKININKSKLNFLIEKNNNLSNNKNLVEQPYTIKINSNQIEIKSFYTSQISKLNKLINFFTSQCKYSDNEINKLKDKKEKLIGSDKDKNQNQKEFEYFSIKNSKNLSENEKINNLRTVLKKYIESEKKMKKKLNLYRKKIKEIENPKDIDDLSNKSQIEFGIDNDNPYYTDDNKNKPEISNKFTSSQFNQFTYILFKNFEARGISFEESKTKLINLFLQFNKNNNTISNNIVYPSKEFDLIVNGYTKIIMEILNCDNKYNSTLIKIFIGALFYNSECNINKLIEYFNVLFSYTRNYNLEKEKYINKLQNKYREQTEKLISCIKEGILNDLNSSKYFSLLKMKELLENNKINLKDKYIEFLFYYMKQFDDPEAKLGELKISLLNDIIPLEDPDNNNNSNNNINIINGKEEQINNKNESKIKNEIKENSKNYNKEKEKEIEKEKFDDESDRFKKDKKSVTEENFSKKSKKNNLNEKDNSDDLDDDEDSMTEITNEEYVKQLLEAISLINNGIKESKTNFNDLMTNVVQKRKINGHFYECITIEDFNEQLKSIKVVLSDLKLSCLCSKYSIPNELRLIDKIKIEDDIQKHIKGILNLEEEEKNNSN